jgi:phosphoglycolate phosphatase-like HAD superfamily hydrolase
VRAVIFDWSGTLSNNVDIFVKVCELMFKELGKEPLSKKELKDNFTLPYMSFWNKYFPDLTKEKQDQLFRKYVYQFENAKLYGSVIQILDFLKKNNYKIFVLSSDPIIRLSSEIKESGVELYLEKYYADVHKKEEVLPQIIKEYSLDINDSFYVGDTSGDVDAGKYAGVKTIGISWGFQSKHKLAESKPDYLIDDIIELKQIIEDELIK